VVELRLCVAYCMRLGLCVGWVGCGERRKGRKEGGREVALGLFVADCTRLRLCVGCVCGGRREGIKEGERQREATLGQFV
jgi:hypothetical protein